MINKERYSFVMLTVISIVCSFLAVFFSFKHADNDTKDVCQLMAVTIQHPSIKPKDPAKDPSRELTYEKYVAIVAVSHRIGCPKVSAIP